MNFIKNILGRLFALWALIVFVLSLIVVFIPIWLSSNQPEPERTIRIHKWFNIWMKFFFTFSGVKRIIKGTENFKKDVTYVVVCNHNSFMDILLATPVIPGPNKTIAKIEMAKIPIFGTVYKSGSVLVDRKSEESRRNSYLKMKEVLQMGLHMCIYPEGTRNKTKEPMQRFHDGAFKLAVDTQTPIIPAVIFDTNVVLPRKFLFYWPHKVEMHFLPEVSVANKTSRELKEEVFEIMTNYYVNRK